MDIFAIFKYYGNVWDRSWKTLMTFHKWVKGLTIWGFTLLIISVDISAIPWIALDFMINLNNPCFKSHSKIMVGTIDYDLPPTTICHLWQVHMHVDGHRTLLTPPNGLEKSCLHLPITSIGDKLFPWHRISFVWETKHPTPQSIL